MSLEIVLHFVFCTQDNPTQSRRESPELPLVSILLFHPQHIHIPVPPPPPPPSTAATGVPLKTSVRTRGKQHVPFLQVNSCVAERRTSPLLQDVVRPLQAAGLLAATLTSEAHKWRGIALLPQRTSVHADIGVNGPLGDAWQEVGDRMRDIRATRGKYVRLDLRYDCLPCSDLLPCEISDYSRLTPQIVWHQSCTSQIPRCGANRFDRRRGVRAHRAHRSRATWDVPE